MPIVNIPIVGYKPFYIQYGTNATATDTKSQWGMVAQVHPYTFLPDPKDPYSNDWKDENGDDEYTATMHYKAFEIEVQFYVKVVATGQSATSTTAAAEFYANMRSFFDAVKAGEFKIFMAYTQQGFQKVRYAGFEMDEDGYKARDKWVRASFKVKFKVNDPVTVMTMSNGAIVEAS